MSSTAPAARKRRRHLDDTHLPPHPSHQPSHDHEHDHVAAPAHRADLDALSLRALKVELHRRHLSTAGLRRTLVTRLDAHLHTVPSSPSLASVYAPPFLTVPRTFSHSPVPNRAPDRDAKVAKKQHQSATSPSKRLADDGALIPALLQARSVWVCGEAAMRTLWRRAGPMGKASLSRSAPSYVSPLQTGLKGRALRQYLELTEATDASSSTPMSSTSTHSRANVEHLQLTLIEAFYLLYVDPTIVLTNVPASTSPRQLCAIFDTRYGHRQFIPRLVLYCRYRLNGWLPRSGLKYGVDWVLYPCDKLRNNKHSHSPYCLVLRFPAHGGDADAPPPKLDKNWITLQNKLRLVKNVSKTLVVADVSYDLARYDDMLADISLAFKLVTATELTIDRWVP